MGEKVRALDPTKFSPINPPEPATREFIPKVYLAPKAIKVIILTAQGLSINQIAEKVGQKPRTVSGYRSYIYDTLGTHNMFDSIIKAVNMDSVDIFELIKNIMNEKALEALEKQPKILLQALDSLANGNSLEYTAESLHIKVKKLNTLLNSAREKAGLKENLQGGLKHLPITLLYMADKKTSPE